MKRSLIIFMVLILCCITTSCYTTIEKIPVEEYQKLEGEEPYTEGDGTLDNPYVIDTKGKLIYLSNQIEDGKGRELCYELQADIDLEGINWNPIHYFTGHFNGNGYEISNFIIKNKYQSYKYYINCIGLFESNAGTIEKLGVTNFEIDMYWTRKGMSPSIGGIAGKNYNVIKDCYVIGRISGICTATVGAGNIPSHKVVYIGGIAGENYSFTSEMKAEIINCYSNVDVKYDIKFCGWRDKISCINADKLDYGDIQGKNINCAISGYEKKEYYINELGWSEDIWDFDNPEFQNGGYLKLKRNQN